MASFNFMGLPLVLQTQIAHYLPKEDLASKVCVSKAVKKVFDDNQVWAPIAKEMQAKRDGKKIIKQECVEQFGRIVSEANRFLLDGALGNTVSWILPVDKKRLEAISDPFIQRSEIIKYYQSTETRLRAIRSVPAMRIPGASAVSICLNTLTLSGGSHKQSLEAAKTLLKSGVNFLHEKDKKELFFCAGEKNPAIFKAYISGQKALSHKAGNLFGNEISEAIDQNSPIFLRLLLQEVGEYPNYFDIAKVINKLSGGNDKTKAEEMWEIILEKYRALPEFQKTLQNSMEFVKAQPKEIPIETIVQMLKK